MDFSITLQADERKTLLDYYRAHPDPNVRLRTHIILLLADGHPWSLLTAVLFCSTATISRWKKRFEQRRINGLIRDCYRAVTTSTEPNFSSAG